MIRDDDRERRLAIHAEQEPVSYSNPASSAQDVALLPRATPTQRLQAVASDLLFFSEDLQRHTWELDEVELDEQSLALRQLAEAIARTLRVVCKPVAPTSPTPANGNGERSATRAVAVRP